MRYSYYSRTARMIDDQDSFELGAYMLGDDMPSLDAYDYMAATSAGTRETEPDITVDDEDSDEVTRFTEFDAFLLASTSGRRTIARAAGCRPAEIEARLLGGLAH